MAFFLSRQYYENRGGEKQIEGIKAQRDWKNKDMYIEALVQKFRELYISNRI